MNSDNLTAGLKKCKARQVRSRATGRCRNKLSRSARRTARVSRKRRSTARTMSTSKLVAHLRKLERSGKMAERQRIIESELMRR